MENARECYHCAASHPELGVTFPIGITPEFSAKDAALSTRTPTARAMASHGPGCRPCRRLLVGDRTLSPE